MEAPKDSRWREQAAWISILVCLCFLVLDRGLILHQFGFRYVDDDQAIMWNGAMEMAEGRFHEPCFYGQRYSTMLEGLVAVPLLWMGVGPEVALPLMTSVLSLFPFALLAGVMVRQRAYFLAALMLVLPVTLPPEYGMVSSMPRGFSGGVFLASLAVLPLFSRLGVLLFLSPFFGALALLVNPNAALVLVPAGLFILLRYGAERRFHVLGLAGVAPAVVLYLLVQWFYDARPNYVIHDQLDLTFSISDIRWKAIRYLDEVSPLLWGKGAFVFALIAALLGALCFTRKWKAAVTLFIGALLLVASFGVNKVNDGIPSIFYSWTRMFLAVPFLLALFVTQVTWRAPQWSVLLLPILAAGFFGYKCVVQDAAVERQMGTQMLDYMEVREVPELRRICERIDHVARDHQVGLIVVSWGANKHLINHACSCLVPGFPKTMEPYLDRRTWWLQAVAPAVFSNVLFSGIEEKHFKNLPALPYAIEQVSQEPILFLVQGNVQRTDSLLDQIRIGMRAY